MKSKEPELRVENAYLNWNQRCQICRNSRGFAKQDYVISRSASHEKAKHHLKCLQSLNVGDERCNNCGRWHTKKSFVTFYYNMKKEYPHRWCISCYDARVEVLKESIREDKKTLKAIQATRE